MDFNEFLGTVKRLKLFGSVAAVFFLAMFAGSGIAALSFPWRTVASIVFPFAVLLVAVTVMKAHPLEKLDDGK